MLGPVLAKLIRYESLLDGSIDLADIALLNDALAVRRDNEELAAQRERNDNG